MTTLDIAITEEDIEVVEQTNTVDVSEQSTVISTDEDGSVLLIGEPEIDTLELVRESTLTIERTTLETIEVGIAGPQGPSGTNRFFVTAAITLSGHRVVVARDDGTVEYADDTTPDLHRAPWLTTGAALAGDSVEVLALGKLEEPSWTWTPGEPLFLSSNGLMTQTAPLSPAVFVLQVGVAITPTLIFFDPKMPIALL